MAQGPLAGKERGHGAGPQGAGSERVAVAGARAVVQAEGKKSGPERSLGGGGQEVALAPWRTGSLCGRD